MIPTKKIAARDIYSLFLLCLGYFVDFYDLTIMSVSYSALFHDQFHLIDPVKIHKLYFMVSSVQTIGVLAGAIVFGFLGDKIGRAKILKYSIFIYSVSTFLVLFTHSIPLFFILRFFSYFGLATEFSTSTVLIIESLPINLANFGTSLLYVFGVLGGITATFIGFLSWKIMFLIGATIGVSIYLLRRHMIESLDFLQHHCVNPYSFLASLKLLKQSYYLKSICRYLCMILPFQSIITIMFVFPMLFVHHVTIGYATKILLIGFFVGNILSCFLGAFMTYSFFNYKFVMYVGLGLFLFLMTHFDLIHANTLFVYALGLGFVGGAYPVAWAQQMAVEFDISVRCTMNNLLFGLGRLFGIILNILLIYLVTQSKHVVTHDLLITQLIIFALALVSVGFTPNLYRAALKTTG